MSISDRLLMAQAVLRGMIAEMEQALGVDAAYPLTAKLLEADEEAGKLLQIGQRGAEVR